MLPPRAISRRTAMLTGASAILSHRLAAEEGREPAPRFTAKSLDGEKFSNEALRGKVVLVQFWATWCQYCRRDQPSVDAIVEDFADKGLVVLAVNVGEPKRKVKQYLAESPRSCRIVLMEDTNLAALYAARTYPLYVLIDREGNVAGRQTGAAGEDALRRLLRKAGMDGE
jgi:thiol-disulfide isomerase/thioredoxin